MLYEVEQKFPVADFQALESRLLALGAKIGEAKEEVDLYFAHPSRNFAKTDEALRIRRQGSKNFITYKGPKIDQTTKTRKEIDLILPPEEQSAQIWQSLLEALGFTAVHEVRKLRRKAKVAWQGRQIECSLDQIDRLGSFCELELQTGQGDLDVARSCIASLAAELGLKESERRSYLELLLEKKE